MDLFLYARDPRHERVKSMPNLGQLQQQVNTQAYKHNLKLHKYRIIYKCPETDKYIYSRLSLSRTFKGPGDLFEIEKVRDIENLTK